MPDHLQTHDQGGLDRDRVRKLVESFFRGRNERTLRAYRADLRTFCAFLDVDTVEDAARRLLGHGHGAANGLALDFKNHLVDRGLAPATVNRRLAAVRSLVRLARTLGLVPWHLELRAVPTAPIRDTKGPARSGFLRLLQQLDGRTDGKARRDRALLRLMYDLALRREEVVSLDVEHLDLDACHVEVMGKGQHQRHRLTLPEPTKEALRDWLVERGAEPGPLFVNFDRAGKGDRLTGRSVHRLVQKLGKAAGLTVRPHGIRHAAITEALDVTKGDVRAVQKFSRHADVRVLQVYDDVRRDMCGEVAKLVAAGADLRAPVGEGQE